VQPLTRNAPCIRLQPHRPSVPRASAWSDESWPGVDDSNRPALAVAHIRWRTRCLLFPDTNQRLCAHRRNQYSIRSISRPIVT